MDRPVILGFVPTAVAPVSSSAWVVTASVDDPLEANDGWMVAAGDVVFLDHRASVSAPGTVSRYLVTSIVAASSRQVSVNLEWGGAAAPVSPLECMGLRGYLAQPLDGVGTVKHPVQQTILVEQEVIDLAKMTEVFAIGEGGGASSTDMEQSFPTDEVLTPRMLVHVLPNGKAVKATPQDASRMPALGVVLAYNNGTVRVRTGGIVASAASGLIPGAPVFVGDAGLPVTDPAGITLPAAFQILGVALNSSDISLSITGQMVKRA